MAYITAYGLLSSLSAWRYFPIINTHLWQCLYLIKNKRSITFFSLFLPIRPFLIQCKLLHFPTPNTDSSYMIKFFMAKHISCCGFDCSKCRLYISPEALEDLMREKTAESAMPAANAAAPCGIKKEFCGGCRSEKIKFHYCEACEMRKCVMLRGIVSCLECAEINFCAKAASIRKKK